MLKESIYNYGFYFNDEYFIFNTNSGALVKLDKEPIRYVGEQQKQLRDCNILVESMLDEFEVLEKEVAERVRRKSHTLDLTVVLTMKCNFKCIYCYQTSACQVFTQRDKDALINSIQELIKRGVTEININYFGGEPLISYKMLHDIDREIKQIAKVHRVTYHSIIPTNGSLLSEEILSEIEFDTIQLTFDGGETWHNKLRLSDFFNYRDLLNALSIIYKSCGSSVRIRFNICEENKTDFFQAIDDILNTQNYDNKRTSFLLNVMRNTKENESFTELSPKEYSAAYLKIKMYLKSKGIKLSLPRAIAHPCKFTTGNAFCIGPGLKSFFCTSSSPEKETVAVLDEFNNHKFEYRLNRSCANCVVLPLCLNSCALLEPKKNACIPEKYILRDLLMDYLTDPSMWNS